MKKIFLQILVLFFCVPNAYANLEFQENTNYISFSEPDPAQVFKAAANALRSNKCRNSHHSVFACTNNSGSHKWRYEEISKTKCKISSLNVIEKITYNIPDWENADDMPNDITRKWDTYVNDAIDHEKQHGDIIKSYMTDAYNQVLKLRENCKRMNSQVKQIFKKAEKRMIAAHKRLDSVSGRTANASLLK